jgi:hypothetical protein
MDSQPDGIGIIDDDAKSFASPLASGCVTEAELRVYSRFASPTKNVFILKGSPPDSSLP